jgi:hypothetical protein
VRLGSPAALAREHEFHHDALGDVVEAKCVRERIVAIEEELETV